MKSKTYFYLFYFKKIRKYNLIGIYDSYNYPFEYILEKIMYKKTLTHLVLKYFENLIPLSIFEFVFKYDKDNIDNYLYWYSDYPEIFNLAIKYGATKIEWVLERAIMTKNLKKFKQFLHLKVYSNEQYEYFNHIADYKTNFRDIDLKGYYNSLEIKRIIKYYLV